MSLTARAACVAFLFTPALVSAQNTIRLSVDSSGGEPNHDSTFPSVTPDLRYVAFRSFATDIVPGDTNSSHDVFVLDRQDHTNRRVSVSSTGVQGNWDSGNPSISADGRYVAFDSGAGNLVAGDTNGMDVFVHDLATGNTTRVSVDSLGGQGNGFSQLPSLSADGRYVAFSSYASNLVAGDTNGMSDVFVHDRVTGATTRVSVSSTGGQGNGNSAKGSLSSDGRYVVFKSGASTFPGGGTFMDRVYVHDRTTGTTTLVSVTSTGVPANDSSEPHYQHAITPDGRFVAFHSFASNMVPGDTNFTWDAFVRDMVAGTTVHVSVSTAGAQGNGGAGTISDDGRFIAFVSTSSLAPGDVNGTANDVYVRDLHLGTTELVSVDSQGTVGNLPTTGSLISADGRHVVISSAATNLIAGDGNGAVDLFLRDRGAPYTAFCAGDGSGTACPCGNHAPPGASVGCLHSGGRGGRLVAVGNPNVGADTLVLVGSDMPNTSTLYIQGSAESAGGAGVVFGDGLRCAAGTVVRLGTHLNVAGSSLHPSPGNPSISGSAGVSAGDVRTYQAWYRNPAVFCTAATFNLTNGIRVTWLQ